MLRTTRTDKDNGITANGKPTARNAVTHGETERTKITYGRKRICSECGKKMKAGYCINNGMEYFCSEDCLHKHYSEEEYLEMYDDGNGDSYWTEWDDDE